MIDIGAIRSHQAGRWLLATGTFAFSLLGIATLGLLAGSGPIQLLLLGLAPAAVVAAWAARLTLFPIVVLLLAAPIAQIDAIAGAQVVQILAMAPTVAVAGGMLMGRYPPTNHPVLAAGSVFILAVGLAALASQTPTTSLPVVANQVLAFGLAVAVPLSSRTERGALRSVARAWSVGSLGVLLPALAGSGPQTVRFGGSLVEGRVAGPFAQPNEFAEYALLTLTIALVLAALARRWYDRVLSLGAALAAVSAVAMSLSRGTWLGLAATIAAIAILVPRWIRPALALFGAGLLLMAAAAGAMGNSLVQGLWARAGSVASGAANPSDSREIIYSEAWRLWGEHQWLGVGPGGYAQFSRSSDSLLTPHGVVHAHNLVLHTGVEAGVVGVAALLVLIGTLVATLVVRLRSRGTYEYRPLVAVLLFSGLIGVAAHGIIDYVYTNPLLLMSLWLMMGMLVAATAPEGDSGVAPADLRRAATGFRRSGTREALIKGPFRA